MKKSNTALLKIAEKHLGQGGARFRAFCGLPSNAAWCNAFVDYVAAEGEDQKLYFNGKKETYCPHSIKWCYDNLADIPLYLAMPMDIIYFDWEKNGVPNHIGFVRERKDCEKIYTIEGNTSGGIVAKKTRTVNYVQAVFRPHFTGKWEDKELIIDGQFGYNSIAMLQKALMIKQDGILGQGTVKALQKLVGVTADGSWGTKTSKAVQKLVGAKVDGYFGVESVKALQKWINTQNMTLVTKPTEKPVETKPVETEKPKTETKKTLDLTPWFDALKTQYEWSKHQRYHWCKPTVASSKKNGTCVTFPNVALQRLGMMPKGKYFYLTMDKGKITGTGKKYVLNHPEMFSVSYPHKTIKQLGSKIKKGDIIAFTGKNGHIMVYRGKNKNGKPLFSTMGHKRGMMVQYPAYANKKISMLVRIKKIPKQK